MCCPSPRKAPQAATHHWKTCFSLKSISLSSSTLDSTTFLRMWSGRYLLCFCLVDEFWVFWNEMKTTHQNEGIWGLRLRQNDSPWKNIAIHSVKSWRHCMASQFLWKQQKMYVHKINKCSILEGRTPWKIVLPLRKLV